jgi:hypothetical protein
MEQRIALLRHVEALRLFAAEHGGILPEQLADVAVPLPTNPFTGKSFVYKRQEESAHLWSDEKAPRAGSHFELTIRK